MVDDIYTRNGYKNREDYLRSMADDYGVPPTVVFEVAGLLGQNEDFDGLVTSMDDFSMAGFLDGCGE